MKAVAAAAVAAGVVIVVVLGGGRCGAAHLATNNDSDVGIPESGKEKLIFSEAISQDKCFVTMYMLPSTDFEGVRAALTTNLETFSAWFPIADNCTLNNSLWYEMSVAVEKDVISAITINLAVHNFILSCEQTTDPGRKNGTKLQLQKLELFGHGASKWNITHPDHTNRVVNTHTSNTTVHSQFCTKPPPITSASPPPGNTEQQSTELQTIQQTTHEDIQGTLSSTTPSPSNQHEGITPTLWAVVVVVVMLVIVMVVAVVLLRMRREGHRQYKGNQLTHSIQDVQDTRNSLYESFDQYQQHFSGPGQGDAPPDAHR